MIGRGRKRRDDVLRCRVLCYILVSGPETLISLAFTNICVFGGKPAVYSFDFSSLNLLPVQSGA